MKKDKHIFYCSIFFVLGFSLVFSFLGILLQTVLENIGFTVQTWNSRVGGLIIGIFGLYLLGLIKLDYLEKEHKLKVKKFHSRYVTAFIFGAAFAIGWSPCVGPVLGAVLALAATQPTNAFFMLLAYSLGMGIPFLAVGLFTNQAKQAIKKYAKYLEYINKLFGVLLVAIGTLMFTQQLDRFAGVDAITNIMLALSADPTASLTWGVAFLAGLISFLSPCVLPIIPGFLAYLASISIKK